MKEIRGKKSRDIYIYDNEKMTLTDKQGITIKLHESLEGISDNNIGREVDYLFHKIYEEINSFKELCLAMKRDQIEWGDFK